MLLVSTTTKMHGAFSFKYNNNMYVKLSQFYTSGENIWLIAQGSSLLLLYMYMCVCW